MKIDQPPGRRELESAVLTTAYGLEWLELTVPVQAGVNKKTGEARYKPLTTRYLVRRQEGAVRLVTGRHDPGTGEALAYTVTAWGCDCMDAQVRGRGRTCKHYEGCREAGLLPVA